MGGVNCIDYSTLAVSSSAVTFGVDASPILPTRAKGAIITVETDQARYRIDGTAPTSTEGHLLEIGDVLTFDSWTEPTNDWRQVLNAIQFIRVTTDAALKISWFD